jgi:23S rRNA (uracil1939-C5)-methyltransferase
MTSEITCTIETLAHKGEGRAETADGSVHVPFTLPGETVRIARDDGRARLLEVLTPAPERVEPLCPHFGTCGGCALQHMDQRAILDWKRAQVIAALAARGFEDIDRLVEPTVDATGEGRRRAVFAAARAGSRVMLGFHERASHRLVDLRVCPVVLQEIVAAMDDLRELASLVMPRKGEVTVTVLATGTGLDVALATPAKISPRSVPQIVERAMGAGFARLSLNGETLVEARAPILSVDGLPLVPPPGGFVQATEAGEQALAKRVLECVGKARNVADLFAGSGTFALRLARGARGTCAGRRPGRAESPRWGDARRCGRLARGAGRAPRPVPQSADRHRSRRFRRWLRCGRLRSAARRCGGAGARACAVQGEDGGGGLLQSGDLGARFAPSR